jgi:ABC-type bacteriocin/lantibiotic exporter with double-glycine peptidase domain
MKYHSASFKLIANELLSMRQAYIIDNNHGKFNETKKIIFKNKLEIKKLDYYYPASKSKIFNQASFSIDYGDIIGISGSSGAGKSTLVDLMTGLLKPSAGEILVDGFNINKSSNNWQQQIGYVPQDIYLLDDTIKANICFGVIKSEFNEENYSKAIELAQLKNFIKLLPDKENTQVGDRGIKLSGGQRQRIGIARSLYFRPNILIFDEPTSALDVENEKKIIDDLHKLSGKLTIIIVSHRNTVFEKCKKILHIENGKIEERIN